jgi:hypothetical protein
MHALKSTHALKARSAKRHAVHVIATATCITLGIAVAAGCASRSGLTARSDKSPDGAIQFAAAQIASTKTVHVHGVISGTLNSTIDGSLEFAPLVKGDLTVKTDQYADLIPNHVVYDGTTLYTALTKGERAASKTKPNAAWLAFATPGDPSKSSPILAALRSDPAALVKLLLAKGKFTQAETGKADGVAATRFTADFTGDSPGHVDVWLDGAGLPVETAFQPAADHRPEGRTELHFSRWGQPVTITAPPADQVLTEDDPIDFAISGQQFTISADELDGSKTGDKGFVINSGPTPTAGQSTCFPVTIESQPSPAPTVPTQRTACVSIGAFPTAAHS